YGSIEADAVARAGLADGDRGTAVEHLIRLAGELLEFPRHLSVHPGGVLLGHEPGPDLVPIGNAAMARRTVIPWGKAGLADLALSKLDPLGPGPLHPPHLAFDLTRDPRSRELTLAGTPLDDEPTYDMICRAETLGTFQIESRAQMSMLPRLKPRTFYDLVIEV